MRWLAILLLSGCTSLLDLADTTDVAADQDGDGVGDPHDNCRGLANARQEDLDGDGVGDACDLLTCAPGMGASINRDVDQDGVDDGCDSCLLGPNDDEDADGIPDRCDACPATADSQADADGDFVGDACDLSATAQRRVIFDGFAAGPPPWIDPGWRVEMGALGPDVSGSSTTIGSMGVLTERVGWFIGLGVVLGADGGASVALDQLSCNLEYDSAQDQYRLDAVEYIPPPSLGGQVVFGGWIAGNQRVAMRMRAEQGPTGGALTCEVGEAVARIKEISAAAVPELTATTGITIEYVELVR